MLEHVAKVKRVATPSMNTTNTTQPRTPTRPRIDTNRTRGTPRRHKTPRRNKKPGIKHAKRSIRELQEELEKILKLLFAPEEWQAYLIQRVLQGYDSIFCAGTGYGKSLVFEGIAALGGQKKITIVISPLKSLQKDQVSFHILYTRRYY
jgi:superfamily II DNA helicase RecQ